MYFQQGQYAQVLAVCPASAGDCTPTPWRGQSVALQQEALQSLGQAYQSLGQYQKAVDHYEESLNLARALDNQLAQKLLLKYLAACYAFLGLPDRGQQRQGKKVQGYLTLKHSLPKSWLTGSPQEASTPANTPPNAPAIPSGQVPSSKLSATPESHRRDLAMVTDPNSPKVANPAGKTEDTQAIARSHSGERNRGYPGHSAGAQGASTAERELSYQGC